MIKIMFVCHGNICRSPMAEFIFKKMAADCGREGDFSVASCATSTEEIWNGIGNPVYPPAREELLRHGINPKGKRAVQLKRDDLDKYDLFVCMDRNNIRNAERILGGRDKLCLLKDFTTGGDVSDPWYSGDFSTAYNDIYEGCKALIEKY